MNHYLEGKNTTTNMLSMAETPHRLLAYNGVTAYLIAHSFHHYPSWESLESGDLETHASRLDMAKYAEYINRPISQDNQVFIVYGGN